jgi:hypothetical protein
LNFYNNDEGGANNSNAGAANNGQSTQNASETATTNLSDAQQPLGESEGEIINDKKKPGVTSAAPAQNQTSTTPTG